MLSKNEKKNLSTFFSHKSVRYIFVIFTQKKIKKKQENLFIKNSFKYFSEKKLLLSSSQQKKMQGWCTLLSVQFSTGHIKRCMSIVYIFFFHNTGVDMINGRITVRLYNIYIFYNFETKKPRKKPRKI